MAGDDRRASSAPEAFKARVVKRRSLRDRLLAVPSAVLGFVLGLGPIVLGLLLLLGVLFGLYFFLLGRVAPTSTGTEVPLSRLNTLIDQHKVAAATLYDEDARAVALVKGGGTVFAAYPRSDTQTTALIDSLRTAGATVSIDQQVGKAQVRFVVQYLLPLVILAAMFGLVFLITASGGGASEFTAFSRIGKGKTNVPRTARVTFKDVAAADEALTELREIVDYLKDPGRYVHMGARAPKGVLLVGPPGTGKTLLARAVAGEAGVPFFSLSGSEFVESLVGVGAARVRDLFRKVREAAPAILFIDELDAAGRQRGAGMGQGNDEREQTLNQMLVEMDGFSASMGVTVLGATNRPDILDPALLRPGRFDRQVVVDAPDVEGRVAILQLHSKGRPVAPEVDWSRIAKQTPGFTGAELANLVNEAALVGVRAGRSEIDINDLEEAVDRVIAGPQRRSHILTDEEKKLVACHEAGHAVVAAAVGMQTGVQKLSIVARGRTLGHTTTYQISDRVVLSEDDLRRQVTTLMGGLAAEEILFGQITTGNEGDLRNATQLARAMVATYGMGQTLGRAAFAQKAGEVFLGRDFTKMQEVSQATLEAVDREVHTILDEAETHARTILEAHRDVLDSITAHLLEHETLSGPDLQARLEAVAPHVNGHARRARRQGAAATNLANP
ncbi:MAG TPA: ATP-dependent zinc metalloprotease FtsH [Candidatus Angelobacter sp.]|jgi:cell division protease FtsH|nr:ATP-dependent zinc metalloprotease FtsH [Candidatus Angelobacter sp.]